MDGPTPSSPSSLGPTSTESVAGPPLASTEAPETPGPPPPNRPGRGRAAWVETILIGALAAIIAGVLLAIVGTIAGTRLADLPGALLVLAGIGLIAGVRWRWTSGLTGRRWGDLVFAALVGLGGVGVLVLVLLILGVLVYQSEDAFRAFGFGFLIGTHWNITNNVYGVVPFVVGTLVTSAIALVIGVPLALSSAIFLTMQAPRWMRGPVGQVIELLAAIPSVVYGFWGLYVLGPYMRTSVEPQLHHYLGWTGAFQGTQTGNDVLTAGVILGVMIIPTISAISRETLAAVPVSQQEAALSLGATNWETTRVASIPYARAGIFGATILGLGRALGETMAVTMTIGNRDAIPTSFFSQGQTIASLIANELYNNSGGLQYSAIIEAGLILLLISLLVNVGARLLLWRVLRVGGRTTE
jgi:phosphate transport system permease protein